MWCLERNVHIQARSTEQHSRQGIQINEGLIRLETESSDFCHNQQTLWTTGSGSICVQTHQPVPTSLQLAARSIRRGRRYHPTGLVKVKGFANPPWNLIPRVLNQVQYQEADIVLVTGSLWKAQPWYALLLSMLQVDWPRPLPYQREMSLFYIHSWSHGAYQGGLKNQGLSDQATSLIAESWRT